MDQVPRYRAQVERQAPCSWDDHYWYRFINIAVGDGETLLVLCERCGRTPLEALEALPVRR